MNSRHFLQSILLGVLILLPVHRIVAEGDSFLATLLRFTGITATPSTVKGNDNFMIGDIWLAQVSAAKASAPQKITTDGSYHSPLWIPGSQSILAMKGDKLVQLNVQGKEEKIRYTLTNNTVLLGFDKQDESRILVLQRPLTVGIFTLANGQITPLPYNDNNPKEREAFAQLRKDFRRYDSVNVSVNDKKQPSSKGYRSVYTILIELLSGEDISISCPSACSQPALAADGRQLLFIGD
jgi:hypothetical protein